MKTEVSAGAVIYSPEKNKFLLLQHRDGHWEFPKGKQEGDETLTQTLIREIKEEAGVEGRLLTFRTHSTYYFYRKGKIKKTVEYGIILSDEEPTVSSEHLDVRWADEADVLSSLKFAEHKRVFSEVVAELKKQGLL